MAQKTQGNDSYCGDQKGQSYESHNTPQTDLKSRAAEFNIQTEERKCKYGCIPTR